MRKLECLKSFSALSVETMRGKKVAKSVSLWSAGLACSLCSVIREALPLIVSSTFSSRIISPQTFMPEHSSAVLNPSSLLLSCWLFKPKEIHFHCSKSACVSDSHNKEVCIITQFFLLSPLRRFSQILVSWKEMLFNVFIVGTSDEFVLNSFASLKL